MKTHQIINQNDAFIHDEAIRDEIIYALEHDMDYTYFDKTRIDIVEDRNYADERVTLVEVEF